MPEISGAQLKAVLTLRDAFSKPLDDAARNADKNADKMSKSFKKTGESVFTLKNAFVALGVVWAAKRIFTTIVNSTDELRTRWAEWKKEVMDAGPERALNHLGDSFASLADDVVGGASSSERIGEALAWVVDKVAKSVEGYSRAVEEFKTKMGIVPEEKEGYNKTGWAEEKKLTQEEIDLVKTLYLSRADGMKLAKYEIDLIDRYEMELRRAASAAKTLKENNPFAPAEKSPAFDVKGYISSLDEVQGGYIESMKAFDQKAKERGTGVTWDSGKLQDLADAQREITENAEIMDSVYRQAAQSDIKAMNDQLEETRGYATEIRDALQGFADIAAGGVINAAFLAVKGDIKGARQEMKGMFEDLARWMAQQAIQGLIRQGIGMLVGAVFGSGGGVQAGGPAISNGPTGWQTDSPSMNYTSGLYGSGSMKAMKSAPSTTVVNNYNISTTDPQSFEEYMITNKRASRLAYQQNRRENPGEIDR